MLGECVHMEDLVYFFLGDIQNTVIKVCILTKLENNCTNNFLPCNLTCLHIMYHAFGEQNYVEDDLVGS